VRTEWFIKINEGQIHELKKLADLACIDSRVSSWETNLIPKLLAECTRIYAEGGGVFDPALSYLMIDGLPDLDSKNKPPFFSYLDQVQEEGFLRHVLYDYQTKSIQDI